MCKHIQALQEYCINKDLSIVSTLQFEQDLLVLCGTCEQEVKLEGIGPEHPIHEVEDEESE